MDNFPTSNEEYFKQMYEHTQNKLIGVRQELAELKRSINESNKYTVNQLIKDLMEVPKYFLVEIEGCDCIGTASGIEVQDGTILITRV